LGEESKKLQVPRGSYQWGTDAETHHTNFITKSARQRLFFHCRLRRLHMDSRVPCSFYRCMIESILTGCITAWYSSSHNRKALQRVVLNTSPGWTCHPWRTSTPSDVTGQTKSGSQAHHEQKNIKDRYVARIGVRYRGPTLEPGLGLGLAGERLVAGSLPTGPGQAQPEMATWARLPVGSPPPQEGP
ncbi:hypothetical protein L3Q82_014663, partial [Scortum barcoo]